MRTGGDEVAQFRAEYLALRESDPAAADLVLALLRKLVAGQQAQRARTGEVRQ